MFEQRPSAGNRRGFFVSLRSVGLMVTHLTAHSQRPDNFIRVERHAFAAKIRLARAVLGWSQSELGRRVGLTQRAIHKLEQGDTEPRRTTVRALEQIWHEHNIEFEDLADGFRANLRSSAFEPAPARKSRRT